MNYYGAVRSYKYAENTGELEPCPGIYCGRTYLNGSWSNCGRCPRGFRRNETTFACSACDQDLILIDWLYLGFMAILPILLHLLAIDSRRTKSNKDVISLVLCSIFEVVISVVITLIFWSDPFGSFQIKSCRVYHLSDWYPIFYNPVPNYEKTLHCSSEAVYPLYTIVLIFYTLADLLMLVIRISISIIAKVKVKKSIYYGLYFYPILALSHLIFGGLIYYIFPYITIILSVISCSYHFAKRSHQDIKSLFLESIKDWRNLGTILAHWFCHAYGIISITLMENVERDLSLLALVPLPALLYIFTVNFTDPKKIGVE